MSLCGHYVLNGDVPIEDVLDGDVLGGDLMSAQGRPQWGRLRQGHYVLNGDVPAEDVLDRDILRRTSCPYADIMSSTGTIHVHFVIISLIVTP